ncbi:hypothetical protein NDU88_003908 [Pleurodeles waltl]|uniref:Uncharacterized protein n=1 Tax=Pleurodeles waltl TaxID=8319 RepID=A0AAV7M607_PLEWA|nr:hypothetical protein NDU88_003908 [Pleurodeles waltl]
MGLGQASRPSLPGRGLCSTHQLVRKKCGLAAPATGSVGPIVLGQALRPMLQGRGLCLMRRLVQKKCGLAALPAGSVGPEVVGQVSATLIPPLFNVR